MENGKKIEFEKSENQSEEACLLDHCFLFTGGWTRQTDDAIFYTNAGMQLLIIIII